MLTIGGGIILAIVLLTAFVVLIVLMFRGFAKSPAVGCFTLGLFRSLPLIQTMYVLG
jgi:hypothetical protein